MALADEIRALGDTLRYGYDTAKDSAIDLLDGLKSAVKSVKPEPSFQERAQATAGGVPPGLADVDRMLSFALLAAGGILLYMAIQKGGK